jgi:hypothetical protein
VGGAAAAVASVPDPPSLRILRRSILICWGVTGLATAEGGGLPSTDISSSSSSRWAMRDVGPRKTLGGGGMVLGSGDLDG